MKIKSLSFLLALFVITVSCGPKSSSTPAVKYTPLPPEQITAIMENQEMDCASIDGKPCPEGVARLMILDPRAVEKARVCSGFMVDSKTLITNSHCVASEYDCKNTHLAIYLESGYHKTKCKRIIKSEEDFKDADHPRRKLDYAVLEVESEFLGNTFNLATDRAQPDDKVTAWVVDHTGIDEKPVNPFLSRVTEFSCQVERQIASASLMAIHCPVIHGNSGSPITNEDGDVIGVIWGGTDAKKSSLIPLSERRRGHGKGAVTEMIYFKDYVEKNLHKKVKGNPNCKNNCKDNGRSNQDGSEDLVGDGTHTELL